MNEKVILLADDDSDDRDMFCEALADIDKSISCNCAVDGNEFFNKLDGLNKKPQLIFLDLNMPIMNGWQCLKLLKEDERYKDIDVIMISTSSHQREIDIATKLGALGYFVKPSNFNELTQMLRTLVANIGSALREAIYHLQISGSHYIYACAP